jgi:hypothetical protein
MHNLLFTREKHELQERVFLNILFCIFQCVLGNHPYIVQANWYWQSRKFLYIGKSVYSYSYISYDWYLWEKHLVGSRVNSGNPYHGGGRSDVAAG